MVAAFLLFTGYALTFALIVSRIGQTHLPQDSQH
jgi:hypothetical protein